MKWKNRIETAKKFITRDLWFLDIEGGVTGIRKFFLKELQMIVLVIKSTHKNFLFSRASSLAFTTLLSLIPVLAIMFMFFKAFGGDLVEEKIKPMIYDYLTAGIGDSITGYIDSFLGSATVDTLGSIGFIFLLAAVYSILSSIEVSFNAIWQVNKNRSPVEMLKTYLTIVFISPILLVLSLWMASRIEVMVNVGGWYISGLLAFMFFQISPFILMTVMFMFLLVIMPNTQVKLSHAFVGSVFGAVCFTILKALFIHYTKLAVSYNVIYGSIATLPFFMLWIYFSWTIVLLSVEMAFVRQNIHNLKHLEQNVFSNRLDRLRIALMVVIKITKNFIAGKEQSSQLEISSELDIPIKEIAECLSGLEKSGIIIEIAKKQDTYTLNMPLEKLTVGVIADSVDMTYIEHKNFKSEKDYPELEKILSDIGIKAERNDLLTSFVGK
jgi:membrane protein